MIEIPDAEQQPTMTVEQAGEILGISRASAFKAARTGDLPVIRIGGRILVQTAALRRMLGLDHSTANDNR